MIKAFGKKSRKQDGSESGMMVVEAVFSFTIFIMVIAAIVYLISIFMLHNKVQFAINSAAHEIASYSYFYAGVGIKDAGETLESDGKPHTTPINETADQLVDSLNKIENFSSSIGGVTESLENLEFSEDSFNAVKGNLDKLKKDAGDTADSVKSSAADLKNLFSNPKSLIAGIVYIGAYEAGYQIKSTIGTAAARGMTEKYLEQGNLSADEYLKSYGVADGYAGLDFSGSTLFCDKNRRIVDVVVSYDIDLSFLNFIMPEPKLHVVQRVSVAGWVDGDGVKLDEYGVTKI